jgi:hypothetical protein|uniref:Uncharacterized protein n=1 Tax=Amanita brunnescens TaxID=87326 RepID=A0A5Q0N282_AMABU|nr:hypothetical protein [Amanita brunnescens]QFZ98573.1 hypothetical protein [Amanita brunnescens]
MKNYIPKHYVSCLLKNHLLSKDVIENNYVINNEGLKQEFQDFQIENNRVLNKITDNLRPKNEILENNPQFQTRLQEIKITINISHEEVSVKYKLINNNYKNDTTKDSTIQLQDYMIKGKKLSSNIDNLLDFLKDIGVI